MKNCIYHLQSISSASKVYTIEFKDDHELCLRAFLCVRGREYQWNLLIHSHSRNVKMKVTKDKDLHKKPMFWSHVQD